MEKLADSHHPLVLETAQRLTAGASDLRDKLVKIFMYVRDGIRFRFPVNGDFVKASETIQLGYGQCNTKATLLLALCRAAGIPARTHFSRIKRLNITPTPTNSPPTPHQHHGDHLVGRRRRSALGGRRGDRDHFLNSAPSPTAPTDMPDTSELSFTVQARRLGAHGSEALCKDSAMALGTDLAGRRDAFSPAAPGTQLSGVLRRRGSA